MDDLKSIARRAMLDHGLQPDFSAQALAQTSAIIQRMFALIAIHKPTSSQGLRMNSITNALPQLGR